VLLLALSSLARLAAQEPGGEARPPPVDLEIWREGIGSGFRLSTNNAGFALGAGPGFHVFGSRRSHDLALATGGFGWVFTGMVAQNTWFNGNWELKGELFGGEQFHPDLRHVLGVNPLLRYDLATGTRWVPFLQGGVGLSETDIGDPDLSTRFEFNVQAGAGSYYFLTRSMALTLEYRWFHLSNAQMKQPNHGTNTELFQAGLSWFF
jgi:lipid A 3-O-deacylase